MTPRRKTRRTRLLAGTSGLLAAAAFGGSAMTGAATATAGTAPTCGNVVLTKANGTDWQCTFGDEFGATGLDTTRWTPQLTSTSGYTTGPTGSKACYTANAANVSVANGYLRLTARKASAPFTCTSPSGNFTTQYTSGQVSTIYGFTQTYGRFEVRARLPQTTVKGLQETLWLWPKDWTKYGAYPSSGEIDFAEFYSQYYKLDVPYLHYLYDEATVNVAAGTNIATATGCAIDYKVFNTYAVEWVPGRITVTINGKACLVDNYQASGLVSPAPFDQPFFVVLTQALGVGTNAFDPAKTPLPATLLIDYVRAWR